MPPPWSCFSASLICMSVVSMYGYLIFIVVMTLLFSEPTPVSTDWTSPLTRHLKCCTRSCPWLWKRPQHSASNDFTSTGSSSCFIHHQHLDPSSMGAVSPSSSSQSLTSSSSFRWGMCHQNCCTHHGHPCCHFIKGCIGVVTIFVIVTITLQHHHH